MGHRHSHDHGDEGHHDDHDHAGRDSEGHGHIHGVVDPSIGSTAGIHWHMNVGNWIEYIARDELRQVIPWVRVVDPQGQVTEYMSTEAPLSPEQLAAAPIRRMDCVDCHNPVDAPGGVDLTGGKTDFFNVSYDVLARENQVVSTCRNYSVKLCRSQRSCSDRGCKPDEKECKITNLNDIEEFIQKAY